MHSYVLAFIYQIDRKPWYYLQEINNSNAIRDDATSNCSNIRKCNMSAKTKYLSSCYLIEDYDTSIDFVIHNRFPYTYLIGWPHLNKWYYGVQYGIGVHPTHLGVTYFSSSRYVKEFIEKHGKPSFREIRKVFNDPNKTNEELAIEAAKWETTVLIRMKVVENDRWLNEAYNTPFNHGKPFSEERRKQVSENQTGEKHWNWGKKHPPETIRKMSQAKQGENHPMFGKIQSEETKQKKSQALKGKYVGEKSSGFKGYYITPWGSFPSVSEAVKNCPVRIGVVTLTKYCKNNQIIISENAIKPSTYLTVDMIGKTLADIGFGFKPK